MNVKYKTLSKWFILLLSMAVLFFSFLSPLAAEQYEGSVILQASSYLPKQVFNSKLFTIEETVKNDGFVNTYIVKSGNESFQVTSNIALYKLIQEIEAIEALKQVQKSDAFIKSLKESGVATVEGLKNLFTEPGDTLEYAASGLKSLFARAEESIFNSSPGKTEDSRIEQTVGFSNAKANGKDIIQVSLKPTKPLLICWRSIRKTECRLLGCFVTQLLASVRRHYGLITANAW